MTEQREAWMISEKAINDLWLERHNSESPDYSRDEWNQVVAHAAALHALNVAFDEIQGFELDGETVQLRFSVEQLKSLGQWPVTLMRKSAALKAGRKP